MTINPFWKNRTLFASDSPRLLLGLLALVVTNALAGGVPLWIGQLIDTLRNETLSVARRVAALPDTLWLIAGAALLILASRIVSRQLLIGAGRLVEFRMRNALYQKLLKMPPAFFTAFPTGDLMSRMINDVQAMRYLVGGGSLLGANAVLKYVICLPLMASLSPRLTFFSFLVIPLGIGCMSIISKNVKRLYHDVQAHLADMSDVAQENFSGMMVIQSFVREEEEAKRFRQVAHRYYESFKDLVGQRVWLFLVMAMVTSLGILVILAEGGREVIAGELSWGALVSFLFYLEQLSWPTASMGWVVTMVQQGSASMERIDEVLSATERHDPPLAKQPPTLQGAIEIRNLTYRYHNPYQRQQDALQGTSTEPTEGVAKAPVLSNLSLTLSPGSTVALVGPVGCGKTTLLSLLAGQLTPPVGTLFWGGVDITTLPLTSLRQAVTLMPQHSFLFSTTLGSNVVFGNPIATTEAMLDATTTAQLHAEACAFRNGYNTRVGERGVSLSGGQRQRTALARTLLMAPRLLLLDDPFSSVDAETEQAIITALKERQTFEGKTTLIATHRMSILTEVDTVVLMAAGKMTAVGSHNELLANEPGYRALVAQAERQANFERLWGNEVPRAREAQP